MSELHSTCSSEGKWFLLCFFIKCLQFFIFIFVQLRMPEFNRNVFINFLFTSLLIVVFSVLLSKQFPGKGRDAEQKRHLQNIEQSS